MELKVPGNVYLVGGSVRDQLLGLSNHSCNRGCVDRDWVVTGTTPGEMKSAGLKQVGKAFPVFIDPTSGDQYALARIEQKSGKGHQGFEFRYDANVDLRDDLRRRDLTINAMAEDSQGLLIDPFDGKTDLHNKVLRHVSDAFVEDPLRVFRVARFTATLEGFEVASETIDLMSAMQTGLCDLSAERVWNEFWLAMNGNDPYRFFETLRDSDTLDPWFSGISHIALVSLMRKRRLKGNFAVAAIGWVHDEEETISFLRRLKAPGKAMRLARDVARYGHALTLTESFKPLAFLKVLEQSKAFRSSQAFPKLLRAVEACASVDLGELEQLVVELGRIRLEGVSSEEYGWHLREERLRKVTEFLNPNVV